MPFLTTNGAIVPTLDNIRMTVHQDPHGIFTTVVLVGDRHTGIGVAKRNPRDERNEQIGFDVAIARAMRDMADNIETYARGCE